MPRYSSYILIINLILLIISFFLRNSIPSVAFFDSHLKQEPYQAPTQEKPFYVKTPEFNFYIEPVYHYRLYGLVVSKYNALKSELHGSIDKNLNITDICVIWGDNAFELNYKNITFWNGTFTCFARSKTKVTPYSARYHRTKEQTPIPRFNEDQLSNNHLLTGDKKLASKLKNINIGDQIYIEGYLAKYGASSQAIYRGTSTSRSDTGNGACETIYVNDFYILQKNPYRTLFNSFFYSFIIVFIIWLFYYHKLYKEKQASLEE